MDLEHIKNLILKAIDDSSVEGEVVDKTLFFTKGAIKIEIPFDRYKFGVHKIRTTSRNGEISLEEIKEKLSI